MVKISQASNNKISYYFWGKIHILLPVMKFLSTEVGMYIRFNFNFDRLDNAKLNMIDHKFALWLNANFFLISTTTHNM